MSETATSRMDVRARAVELGLTESEYDRITELLDREPE